MNATLKVACQGCGSHEVSLEDIHQYADGCIRCGRKEIGFDEADTQPAPRPQPEFRNPTGPNQPTREITQNARCSKCFEVFSVTAHDPADPVPPCPKCGSVATTVAGSPSKAASYTGQQCRLCAMVGIERNATFMIAGETPDTEGQSLHLCQDHHEATYRAARKVAADLSSGYRWPLADNPKFPGEKTLSCPKCGSTSIQMRGANLTGDPRKGGGNWTTLTCESCGHSEYFDNDEVKQRATASSKCACGHGDSSHGPGGCSGFRKVNGSMVPCACAKKEALVNKVTQLEQQIRQENPHLSPWQVHHLAVKTAERFAEAWSQ